MFIFILFFLTFFSVSVSAQKKSSAVKLTAQDSIVVDTLKYGYRNLESKFFYSVDMSVATENGHIVYEVNEKVVSKHIYDKYKNQWANMETCKPCILYSYDENDRLLSKGIQYTDCIVGFYVQYYPNGHVKAMEQYKENPDNNWANAYKRGYCKKDGCCTYYNNDGTIAKIEIYKDGTLVN